MKVHVLVIDTEHGTSVDAFATAELLQGALYGHVFESWDDLPGHASHKPPEQYESKAAAIQHYFDNTSVDWHIAKELEVTAA